MVGAKRLLTWEWLCVFTAQGSKAVNLLLGNQEEGNCGFGSTNAYFPGHTVAVKTCPETVLVKRSFLTFIPSLHRMPPPSLPSVSALWASPEWCNKAGDGWGLPQQLYNMRPSHWMTPDPSHMIRSIQRGHNSHLSSGDNGGVKLA